MVSAVMGTVKSAPAKKKFMMLKNLNNSQDQNNQATYVFTSIQRKKK